MVEALNEGIRANVHLNPKAHARLLRIVRAWKASGPNLFEMYVPQSDNAQMDEMWKAWQCILVPTNSGRAHISLSPTGPNFDVVAYYFVRLILCPDWDLLGGPCKQCKRWYVKNTHRESEFCSRKCAGAAVKARKQEKRYNRKLQCAQRALKNFRSHGPRYRDLGWRDFVSQATGISKTWLTRAANDGILLPPQNGSARNP
jgi:hypothetical protein